MWCGYEPGDPKLVALYSKGKALQWDAAKALDWDAPIDPSAPVHADVFPMLSLPIMTRLSDQTRDELTAAFTEQALSQFLHGEQGALMVAARLVDVCPDFEAKLYAATQTMQIVVEGAALSSFHTYKNRAKDPLLTALLEGVIRDEARHVGFGTLYVQRTVADMHPDDREEIADFCYDAVLTFSATRRDSLLVNAAALHRAGVSIDDVMRDGARHLASRGPDTGDAVRDGIGDFILPSLRRIGLLTPRVEEKFAQARFPAAPTSSLGEQLQELLDQSEA